MARKNYFMLFLLLTSLLVLSACVPGLIPVSGLSDQELAGTALVRTVEAQQTQAVVDELIMRLTQVAEDKQATGTAENLPTATQTATNTQPAPTATLTATNTPTATSIPPTPTPLPPTATPIPCYKVQFLSDVTVPDGTDFTGGTGFVKTWRLKNIGSCTWTSDFDLIFVSGNAMSAPAVVDMNSSVNPGQTVDVSVSMTAPSSEGTYIGYWKLRSANGVVFGWGADSASSFWVKIDVVKDEEVLDPDTAINFAEHYDLAIWKSTTRTLSINGPSNDYTNGSISYSSAPVLEKGYQDDEPALIMIPSDGSGGMISGEYPAVNVKSGDHFAALIGCTDKMDDCDVMFQLNYKADGGSIQSLGSWTETYDGSHTRIDIDLSSLAGKSVRFILQIQNNGSSKEDRVFWLNPHIVR